jgi:hypothetical protein
VNVGVSVGDSVAVGVENSDDGVCVRIFVVSVVGEGAASDGVAIVGSLVTCDPGLEIASETVGVIHRRGTFVGVDVSARFDGVGVSAREMRVGVTSTCTESIQAIPRL